MDFGISDAEIIRMQRESIEEIIIRELKGLKHFGQYMMTESVDRDRTKSQSTKNGKWKEFNKHAVLIAEGNFLNGRKHGLWREYYDANGGLMIEERYHHGVSHGRFASYHPNGALLSEGKFRNGLREGCFKIYDDNGTNIKNIFFIGDREIESIDENGTGRNTKG